MIITDDSPRYPANNMNAIVTNTKIQGSLWAIFSHPDDAKRNSRDCMIFMQLCHLIIDINGIVLPLTLLHLTSHRHSNNDDYGAEFIMMESRLALVLLLVVPLVPLFKVHGLYQNRVQLPEANRFHEDGGDEDPAKIFDLISHETSAKDRFQGGRYIFIEEEDGFPRRMVDLKFIPGQGMVSCERYGDPFFIKKRLEMPNSRLKDRVISVDRATMTKFLKFCEEFEGNKPITRLKLGEWNGWMIYPGTKW